MDRIGRRPVIRSKALSISTENQTPKRNTIRAKRSLGQNFLVDHHYQKRIVSALRPGADETIVEIGPGRGALTRGLLEEGARLVAIEADRELIPVLEPLFASHASSRLICANALEADYCQLILPALSARVVANLPYNISTPILQRLLERRNCISEMVLMLQREVVDRMTAGPGGKEYGYLSILVSYYCEVERLFNVPPKAFRPSPRVDSSVVRLRIRTIPPVSVTDEKLFFRVTQVLFSQRRKTLLNNLRAGTSVLGFEIASKRDEFENSGIELTRRAETLDLKELAHLVDLVVKARSGSH